MKNIKFSFYERGYCRVYGKEGRTFYCLQPSHDKIELYICSKDGEPEYPIKEDYIFDNVSKSLIEEINPRKEDIDPCLEILKLFQRDKDHGN